MKISACIITRDEPLLAGAVASVRPYVDEIVIVDTGSSEPRPELADKFEVFTDCNGSDGKIRDFSLARQRSFDIASNDTVLWLDADDEVVGLDNLGRAIAAARELSEEEDFVTSGVATRYIAPYEYAYNESGACIATHPRGRILSDRKSFQWVNRVHEGIAARPGVKAQDLPIEGIVWKHRRKGKLKDKERNLRILFDVLREEATKGPVSERTRYDLGHECLLCGLHLQALPILESVAKGNGVSDLRAQAWLWVAEIHWFYKNFAAAESAAKNAANLLPHSSIPHFTLAKITNDAGNPAAAIAHGMRGMDIPEFPTLLMANPQDEMRTIPILVANAARELGDTASERGILLRALKASPNDPALLLRIATL